MNKIRTHGARGIRATIEGGMSALPRASGSSNIYHGLWSKKENTTICGIHYKYTCELHVVVRIPSFGHMVMLMKLKFWYGGGR
ncbi:hypothetical protein H5410_053510 [Solanum commersonii]|uniref:Uncharacterized protein n=1 Tax=Solanum commersonii TaxID=4109 RepID=A0A9J5X423_SOLCO|nr:hypothetical protein H5410_053510 [Solanum commersonii]